MTSDSGIEPNAGARAGTPVLTSDGEQLGELKEIRGPYFKVAAPHSPDYWLQLSFTRTGDKGQIVTTFTKHELGSYKVEDIDAAGLNRSDSSLLGESGTSTDVTTAP